MKRYLKVFLLCFSFLLIAYLLFFFIMVLPSLYKHTRIEKLPALSSPKKISFDLIEAINSSPCKDIEGWLRKDPYRSGCQVSLGKYLWMVESRRAIPARGSLSFEYTPSSRSEFIFGIGTDGKECNFQVFVNSRKVFEQFLSPAPEKGGIVFKKLLKFLYVNFFPQKDFWKDFRISLSEWAGQRIKITLKGSCGYWSSPKILEPARRRKPNLLMIQIDALRADLIGKGILPNLDRLAREGVWFTQSYSNSNWTRPSNIIQFYSKFNTHLGLSSTDFYIHPLEKEIFYRRKFPSLPYILSREGYAVKAVVDNIFIHGFSEWGLDIGFDEVMDFEKLRYESAYILDATFKWLRINNGLPFFLYLDFNQTHFPYKPPFTAVPFGELFRDFYFALYTGCAKMVDYYIGKLLEALDKAGYLENTLIVINADHGECFRLRGKKKKSYYQGYQTIEPHGQTLSFEELRVPLIFYWKAHLSPKKIQLPVSTIDIATTVAGLLGIEKPLEWEGRDLSPLLLKTTPSFTEAPVFLEARQEYGVIYRGWKFTLNAMGKMDDKLVKTDDPEEENLLRKYPETAKKLRDMVVGKFSKQDAVIAIKFKVKEGEVRVSPMEKVLLFGGKGKIKPVDNVFRVKDKGFLYFLVKEPLGFRLSFKGGKIRLYPSGIPTGRSEVFIDQEILSILWFPFRISRFIKKGFTVGVLPLLSFAKEDTFNPRKKTAPGMEQILIEWGYMKK